MQTPERNIYFNFTKSIVDGFDEFVTGIEKHKGIVGDDELRFKLKHISKTLQTIFNKWENTPDKKCVNSSSDEITCNENESKIEVIEKCDSWDDFESVIASTVGDTEPISKVAAAEDTSTSRKSEFSILDIPTTPSRKDDEISESSLSYNKATTLTRKEAEIVRRFKAENVKEEWIRGSKGFYVEYSRGSWKCNPCKKPALSDANIISHASGKSHIKNIGNYSRETSETRHKNNDTRLNPDLCLNSSDVESELTKKINGADVIVPFKGYYCNACRGTLNSEEDLKLHILGGKHRKNCES